MATKKTPTKTAKAPSKSATTKSATAKAATAKKTAAPAADAPALPLQETIQPVEAAVSASQETMDAMVKAGTQAASKSYEQAILLTQEQVEKLSSNMFEGYDDVASLGKDNIDAYVQSTTVFAKGMEAMSKELMSFAQSSLDTGVANAKALFGAKTLRELIDLQTDFSRSGFDALVAESAKLTELSVTLANDTIEPLQVRINANVEKMMKPLAA
jgi:phasin family protein